MKKKHFYHFILDKEVIRKLIRAGGLNHRRQLPRFIVEIFEKFYWLVEKHHLSGETQGCRYRLISEDIRVPRISLWLPFPEELYQRLKSIHKDLDYYSIAQVVRMVLFFYLDMRKDHSHEETLTILDQLQEQWYIIRESFRKNSRQKSHMNKKQLVSRKKLERYKIYYDERAFVLSIQRF